MVGSSEDATYPMVKLTQLYQVKFSKYTMFKSQITARSEEGIIIGLQKWYEHAQKNGHLNKKTTESSTAAQEEEKSP